MATEERSDEALMAAYVGGEEAAFEALFARYAPRLLRLAARHLGSEERAREVVQQTFFQMHAARRDFDPRRKLRPWLFTITMNLVRERFRRKRRRPERSLEAMREGRPGAAEEGLRPSRAPEPPDRPLEARQRAELLREALARLPSSQREVVELHWFQERPFAEVARVVGSSEGAVRVRAHRAYQRLRELLEGALG